MTAVTVFLILAIVAFACTIASAMNRCPLWVPVLLLALIAMLRELPLGH